MSWFLDEKIFPARYKHGNTSTSSVRSCTFMMPTLELDENQTDQMCSILEFEDIRFQFISKRPYEKDLSQGSFSENMSTIYGGTGLCDANLKSYFDKQRHSYKLEHQFTTY